jgi:hypothetical protein
MSTARLASRHRCTNRRSFRRGWPTQSHEHRRPWSAPRVPRRARHLNPATLRTHGSQAPHRRRARHLGAAAHGAAGACGSAANDPSGPSSSISASLSFASPSRSTAAGTRAIPWQPLLQARASPDVAQCESPPLAPARGGAGEGLKREAARAAGVGSTRFAGAMPKGDHERDRISAGRMRWRNRQPRVPRAWERLTPPSWISTPLNPNGATQGAERSKWAKRKRPWEANGGWRRNVRKAMCVKQGDPGGGHESRPEVRAAIVAVKRRSGRGAKGRRKVDARRP